MMKPYLREPARLTLNIIHLVKEGIAESLTTIQQLLSKGPAVYVMSVGERDMDQNLNTSGPL